MIIERIERNDRWCEHCDLTLHTHYEVEMWGNDRGQEYLCVKANYCRDCAAMLFNLNSPEIEG